MVLSAIRVYPVKSLAGVDVETAVVEPWGLRHDRRWIVLEPDGTVLTAREEHAMLAVTAAPRDDAGIVLTDGDGASIAVDAPVDAPALATSLSRLESVRSAGADADAWLGDRLGRAVRLGWLDDPRRRSVSESHGGRSGDVLSLADAGPLLLTTTASLQRLNEWIVEMQEGSGPMSMTRFRPNVVVDRGCSPFAEDAWQSVRIGSVTFRFAEHCDRCVLTTIDPTTRAQGKEPLRTLARHHAWGHKTWFGIRLVPEGPGALRVGDAALVEVASA